MAVMYDRQVPPKPVLPDNPTPEEQAEYDAALIVYARNVRVYYVARQIGRAIFPDQVPAINGAPFPRDIDIADVAVTLADDYAPDAPEHLRDEAAIRAAGWIRDTDPALASRSMGGGDAGTDAVTYRASSGAALRASGGTGLLARYVSRRAV